MTPCSSCGLAVSVADDARQLPSFRPRVVCAKCGGRGRHIDVRPDWKERPERESLTGKVRAHHVGRSAGR
jgi:hypothetical protein